MTPRKVFAALFYVCGALFLVPAISIVNSLINGTSISTNAWVGLALLPLAVVMKVLENRQINNPATESEPTSQPLPQQSEQGVLEGQRTIDRKWSEAHSGYRSEFIGDVNYPDGSILPPGVSVTKTWRIRNIGRRTWKGLRLMRITPDSETIPHSAEFINVPTTKPGEVVDLSVRFTMSSVEGSSQIRFKMVDKEGRLVFPTKYPYGLIAQFVVRRPGKGSRKTQA